MGREAALYPSMVRIGTGPRLAILPSESREGASLLRGYNMATALRHHGWQTLVLPAQLALPQRTRVLERFRPDLVLVQQARHPFNRAAHLGRWPLVLDIDDADFLDPALEPELTALLALARGAVCGSRFIRDWAAQHTRATRIVWTGTPISPGPWPDHAARRPLVTWAQLGPEGYRDELAIVAEVMADVGRRRGGVDLRLYSLSGPRDLPELVQMQDAGVRIEFLPRLGYDAYLASLREAAVGLSAIASGTGFGRGKSFGKILGYLDAKVPIVCSDAADHALFFREGTGIVSNAPGCMGRCRLRPARRSRAPHGDVRGRACRFPCPSVGGRRRRTVARLSERTAGSCSPRGHMRTATASHCRCAGVSDHERGNFPWFN